MTAQQLKFEPRVQIHADDCGALRDASVNGQTDMVVWLLSEGATVMSAGGEVLWAVAKLGLLDTFKVLWDAVSKEARWRCVTKILRAACSSGHFDIARLVLTGSEQGRLPGCNSVKWQSAMAVPVAYKYWRVSPSRRTLLDAALFADASVARGLPAELLTVMAEVCRQEWFVASCFRNDARAVTFFSTVGDALADAVVKTGFFWACASSSVEVLRVLLEHHRECCKLDGLGRIRTRLTEPVKTLFEIHHLR